MRFFGTKKTLFSNLSLDSSAAAYFAAAGITNQTEQQAANTLIVLLKANNLWDLFDRLYLCSPTSSAAALYCAKSLTQMQAVNSPTFSTTGYLMNGSTSYLDTQTTLSSLVAYQLNSAHASVYNRVASPSGGASPVYLGTFTTTNRSSTIYSNGNAPSSVMRYQINSFNANTDGVPARAAGLQMISRSSSTAYFGAQNLTTVNTPTSVSSTAIPTLSILFGAQNLSPNPGNHAAIEFAFGSIGGTLTTDQYTIFYNAVQAYQTALSRNV